MKATFVLLLPMVAWFTTTGWALAHPDKGIQAAELLSGPLQGTGVFQADTQSIVTRRILAGLEDGIMGSPSPDGRYLTDVDWNTGDVSIRDIQTGEVRHVTSEGSWEEMKWAEGSRVSPDGRWVAYTWYEPGEGEPGGSGYGVRIIPVEGGESRPLVNNEYQYAQPYDWSADATRLLVGLSIPDSTTQIGLVATADAELHLVKSLRGMQLGNMALSPDGDYVAYDVQRQASSFEHTVHIVGSDGSGDREVTGPDGHNTVLGWEPSGRYLLYYGDHSGSPSVWALPISGGRPQGEPLLVRSDLWHLIPIGFTAGGALVYGVNTGKVDVFTVLTDPETGAPIGEPQSITPHYQAGTAMYPRWSPDGRYLAYRRTPPPGQGMRHSLVIRAMESGEFREIGLDLAVMLTPGWSTDGRYLALYAREGQTQRADQEGIYRIDVQTGEHGFIYFPEGSLRGVAWLDAGRTVVYKGRGSGQCRFATLELSSGLEREIYRWPCSSADWWWSLSPDKRTIAGVFDPTGDVTDLGENSWTVRTVSLDDGTARDLADFYPWIGDNAAGPAGFSEIPWTPDSRSFRVRLCLSPDPLMESVNRCPNWSFDVETGEVRRLADEAPMGAIHPDGRRVAFADGEMAYEVWIMEGYLPVLEAESARDR